MPIDYEKLLNFPIPDEHQTLTKQDTILYALSVGMGSDPLDRNRLDFVDQHRVLKAVPSIVVVLGHPGFWLADPATGVDAVRLVHGEQGIVWHAPLPVAGRILGRSRVTGLVDKGAGKGALLYVEKRVFDADSDTLLATTTATIVLRADGGFGGPAGPVKLAAPAPGGVPDIVVDQPTRPEQALLYRLNGDDNPLHADPVVAAMAGYPRPILHGLCTFGIVCQGLLQALCDFEPQRMAAMELRFSAPVFPGETIRTEIWRDGGFRARVLERDLIVVNNGRVTLA